MSAPLKSAVLWQCRRGMLELDLVLQRFVEARYDTLTDAQKNQLVALLQLDDPVLYAWLIEEKSVSDVQLRLIVALINAHGCI